MLQLGASFEFHSIDGLIHDDCKADSYADIIDPHSAAAGFQPSWTPLFVFIHPPRLILKDKGGTAAAVKPKPIPADPPAAPTDPLAEKKHDHDQQFEAQLDRVMSDIMAND
ncbi:hypothetical protein RJT34_12036 [Clitoria ternatea]|uniref:Uncharacterized protein n=1 Tax=Clitoria ternatea TaxID=43366 RepID=A0AAN9PIZ0_CLITE